MAVPMGLSAGFSRCVKRKFRWLFSIPDVTEIPNISSVNALPHERSARPSFNFKEMEIQHLNEIIYRPAKAEWKSITLTLYDVKTNKNPVIEWVKKVYDAGQGGWSAPGNSGFTKSGKLDLLDGCGNIIESWTYDNIWPQIVEFGDLDMSVNDYLVIDTTLRYDRAYPTV